MFMQCAPIQYTAAAPEGAPRNLKVVPRMLSGAIELPVDVRVQDVFQYLENDPRRNARIVDETRKAFDQGRKVLILSNRANHIQARSPLIIAAEWLVIAGDRLTLSHPTDRPDVKPAAQLAKDASAYRTAASVMSVARANDRVGNARPAGLGRYVKLYIATPMHSSQLCVAPPAMAVRSAVDRTGARCALHSYRVCRNLIISSQARKRLSLMSAAHRAGGVAATEHAFAVCRNMPFQMSTAARADSRFGLRRKVGSHGSLQVVESPVNLGRKTMCSCSRTSARLTRVIADQMPSRRPRLYVVESYA